MGQPVKSAKHPQIEKVGKEGSSRPREDRRSRDPTPRETRAPFKGKSWIPQSRVNHPIITFVRICRLIASILQVSTLAGGVQGGGGGGWWGRH